MKSKMIERVAQAIYEEGITRSRMGDHSPEALLATARAAIEAMREPTFAMLDAASDASYNEGHQRCVWHDMIDAALAD